MKQIPLDYHSKCLCTGWLLKSEPMCDKLVRKIILDGWRRVAATADGETEKRWKDRVDRRFGSRALGRRRGKSGQNEIIRCQQLTRRLDDATTDGCSLGRTRKDGGQKRMDNLIMGLLAIVNWPTDCPATWCETQQTKTPAESSRLTRVVDIIVKKTTSILFLLTRESNTVGYTTYFLSHFTENCLI